MSAGFVNSTGVQYMMQILETLCLFSHDPFEHAPASIAGCTCLMSIAFPKQKSTINQFLLETTLSIN